MSDAMKIAGRYARSNPMTLGLQGMSAGHAHDVVEMAKFIEELGRKAIQRATQPKQEFGWLIERGDTKPEALLYFQFIIHTEHGITIKHWGWTADHLNATRFCRKVDAELAWQCVTERPLEDVDIVEHGWS